MRATVLNAPAYYRPHFPNPSTAYSSPGSSYYACAGYTLPPARPGGCHPTGAYSAGEEGVGIRGSGMVGVPCHTSLSPAPHPGTNATRPPLPMCGDVSMCQCVWVRLFAAVLGTAGV
ncbi:hypothetical protein ACOMHN_066661 [Nucella lapillus]